MINTHASEQAAAYHSPPKSRATELLLSPVNNKQLANLCGALDENLRQIETALDVSIARRGERFTLRGEAGQTGARLRGAATILRAGQGHLVGRRNPARPDRTAQPAGAPHRVGRRRFAGADDPQERAARPHTAADRIPENIQEHDITFGTGPAGTGKTYLAVASAVDAFERELVQRIVLTRPAVEAGERLGFLPGDLAQKVDPYLRPLYDALYDLMGFERVGKLFERGAIEIAPLAYMRGRTLNHAFIILDEAQNTTPEQMKMFLTRIGIGAKAVVTGDVTQIDLQRGQKSGLIEARQILTEVRGIAFTEFLKEDVVRHPLVARIVSAYEAHTAALEAREAAANAARKHAKE
jgi:phosphate starvation-inducible PhoH-like protein